MISRVGTFTASITPKPIGPSIGHRARTRGRPPAFSECHLTFCSTRAATIPDHLSDAVEKIAMRTPGHERKAHVSGAVSGAVIPLRRDNP